MQKRFCPKCESEDVKKEMNVLLAAGAPQKWICNVCGFYAPEFPEVEEEIKPIKHRTKNGKK